MADSQGTPMRELTGTRVMSRLNALISSAKSASEIANKAGNAFFGAVPPSTLAPGAKVTPKVEGIFGALDELDFALQSIHKELERF